MKILNSLQDFPKQAKVCLYGAGEIGISLLLMLRDERPDVEVLCLIDSFKDGLLYDTEILKPEKLENIDYDFIVITSFAYRTQIEEILKRHGIEKYCTVHPLFNSPETTDEDDDAGVLYAFYDRAVAPDGFDIVSFLYLAEIARIENGCRSVHPVFVPLPAKPFIKKGDKFVYDKTGQTTNQDETAVRDTETSGWWERNILIPCCWILPSCSQISFFSSRAEARRFQQHVATKIFPSDYSVDYPKAAYSWPLITEAINRWSPDLPSFKATAKALDYVSAWLKSHTRDKLVITITLREQPIHQQRNSDLKAWITFAENLDKDIYCPVFIRDNNSAMTRQPTDLDDFLVFKEIPWNMELRMALYELAFLNMFVNNGPVVFSHHNKKIRYLMFMKTQQGVFEGSQEHMLAEGLKSSCQMPGATLFQKTVWQNDNLAVIEKEFHDMVRLIEQGDNKKGQ